MTPTRSCAGARASHGQHIELGIAEGNLVGLLGELGATWSRDGQALLPIGTIYDPFINRALEPWSFGMYAGGQSILVGTPSGVSLAPEGGAHQSITTPSVGLEQPRCVAWEPASARTSNGRCCTRFHSSAGPTEHRPTSGSRHGPLDQALAATPSTTRPPGSDDAATSSPAAIACEPPTRLRQVVARRRRRRDARGDRSRRRARRPPESPATSSASPQPTSIFRALQARQGTRRRRRLRSSTTSSPPTAPRRSSRVIDGHPHTLSLPLRNPLHPDRLARRQRLRPVRRRRRPLPPLRHRRRHHRGGGDRPPGRPPVVSEITMGRGVSGPRSLVVVP